MKIYGVNIMRCVGVIGSIRMGVIGGDNMWWDRDRGWMGEMVDIGG